MTTRREYERYEAAYQVLAALGREFIGQGLEVTLAVPAALSLQAVAARGRKEWGHAPARLTVQ